MRINIKTTKPVKDKELKAMYIIGYALGLVSKRMIEPTLSFFAGEYGYKLILKNTPQPKEENK